MGKWIPPTTKKEVMTTPPEARKLDKEYKENLKRIKEIIATYEDKEKAVKDPELMQLRQINKEKLKKYFEIVVKYQVRHGFGKFGDPNSKFFAYNKNKR